MVMDIIASLFSKNGYHLNWQIVLDPGKLIYRNYRGGVKSIFEKLISSELADCTVTRKNYDATQNGSTLLLSIMFMFCAYSSMVL